MPRTPISRTSAEPTLYEILSLTPKRLKGQDSTAQQKAIKQAYHKALLKHHPDKNPQDSPSDTTPSSSSKSSQAPKSQSKSSNGGKSSSSSSSSIPKSELTYTIDQIQHAYSVLSDAGQRREYDRQLLLTTSSSHSSHSFSVSTEQKHSVSTRFHTGVETVDLDDLGFDDKTGVYFGSCRCGNARGFQFTERQLEEYEEDLVLMVQCLDCSLWMRVLFDAVDDEEDQGGNAPQQQQQQQRNTATPATTVSNRDQARDVAEPQRRGSHSVSKSGKGWRFNLSFDWGLSLSGSASAST